MQTTFTAPKVIIGVPAKCKAFSSSKDAIRNTRSAPSLKLRQISTFAQRQIELSVAAEDDGMEPLKNTWQVDEANELYHVSVRKPLGLILAEQGKKVVVEKVTEQSNGEEAGIKVGDIVRGTTARSHNVKQPTVSSVEAKNKQSFLGGLVLMKTDGEDFDTVLAAIDSSKLAKFDVTLVLERPKQ